MTNPRLLDLFCGAGGAGEGYARAGFDVTGVDNRPMPRNPHRFIQADALEYLAAHGHEYDVIHASPPCQAFSEATPVWARDRHPNLIPRVRELLIKTRKPYVIENVENARGHLQNPLMLCGTMFGLGVWRHRYFEMHPIWALSPSPCNHLGRPVVVNPGSNARRGGRRPSGASQRAAMGISWMTLGELSQAIPPAYTEYIGHQLIRALSPSLAMVAD